MGLHVCAVVVRTNDRRGEFVEIANNGYGAVALTGKLLSDYTATQQNVHIYTFPSAVGGADLLLESGNSAYVFTGPGTNERLDDGDLLLFAQRGAPIWNNNGDVAYLRNPDGTFIDTMTVGEPKRHPKGH
jgi:hypothetical protein